MVDNIDVIPIRLRNGRIIEDPHRMVESFVRHDASYRSYDCAAVLTDNVLTESDVRVANKIVARMGPAVVRGFVEHAPEINAALAAIPPNTSMRDASPDIPWRALETLFATSLRTPGVRLPRATKVLHKKRPALIPILDSVLEKYLGTVDHIGPGAPEHVALALMRSYKVDFDANAAALSVARSALENSGIRITECRLLDICIWAYSGAYLPLWMRDRRAGT